MHLLVFRFSAMGDVALLAPVLKAVLESNSQVHITFVTRPKFAVFFEGIERLEVIGVDLDTQYKGVGGLFQLYKKLNKTSFDLIIDQHQNLRTAILKLFFRFSGIKSFTLVKDRKEKKALTRPQNKVLKELSHTTERYFATFAKAGIKAQLGKAPFIHITEEGKQKAKVFLEKHQLHKNKDQLWIGIAPFAQHENKIWGLHKIEELLSLLPENTKAFLFGGGKAEEDALTKLNQQFPDKTILVAGHLWLPAELALMSQLDKMLSMDSSNMHLASLLGIPTVSIWGATHPFAGFSALQQPAENSIQIDTQKLPCRPCSVFGNKPCLRSDKACMEWIEAKIVLDKLLSL